MLRSKTGQTIPSLILPKANMKPYIFLGLLSALLFGISTPVSKALIGMSDPLPLASLYYLASALILFPITFTRLHKEWGGLIQSHRDIKLLAGSCLFGGILAPVFLLYGVRYTSAASTSLLLNLETVATAMLAHYIFKEKLYIKDWLGALGIVTAGAILVFEKGWIPNLGGLFAALSCVCWGVDNNCTAQIRKISPISNAFFKGLIAGLCNACLSFFTHAQWPSTSHGLTGALLIGMFSFGVSIALYIAVARKIGAFKSQVLFATSPFWGVGLALLFLKEPFIIHQAIASVFLIAGLSIIFYRMKMPA